METLLLTTEEVASALGVSKSTIKRWADEGKLLCYKTPGKHRKFSLENLQEFIKQYQYNIDLSAVVLKLQHKNRLANAHSFVQMLHEERGISKNIGVS